MKIEYTNFVLRQFDPKFAGTKLNIENKDNILDNINYYYDLTQAKFGINSGKIVSYKFENSYQDFCKYLIIENHLDKNIKAGVTELTLEKYPFIRTGYSSRTPEELPVLSRWLELPSCFEKPKANYLVLVLYTREQLLKEHIDNNSVNDFELSDECEYGIVAVLGTLEPKADPMPPITIMRNALGTEEGGNGAKLDHSLYKESVEFWDKYILIK